MLKLSINLFFSILFLAAVSFAEDFFSSCRFHFGTEISRVYDVDKKTASNPSIINELDYFTGPWVGSAETFNIGNFFTACKTLGKTPVVVSYIIAFAAKRDLKIDDCNVSSNNLCKKGANYIRNNRTKILTIYSTYAKGIASTYGTDKPVIWCMEPDYSQYTESMQEGGGISYSDAGNLMSDIVSTVKKELPKSMFSMDISPWKDTTWQNNWFTELKVSENFSFINTSGGGSKAASTFISDDWADNLPTWAWVLKRWGKPVIADAGYGVNGGGTGHDSNWDNVTNLNARIADGAIGISQYNPRSDWAKIIQSNRSSLVTLPKCPIEVVSTLNSHKNGKINASNNDNRFQIVNLSGKILMTSTFNTNMFSEIKGRLGTGVFLMKSLNGTVSQRIFIGK